MPWNSDTQQFDPPPPLSEILSEADPIKYGYQLVDFVSYKSQQKGLQLSETEQAFYDTYEVYGLIMGDGWDGLFDCYSMNAWNRVFTVLSFLRYSTLENALREALRLRNPRPIPPADCDDPTVAQLEQAQPTPEEKDRFYALEPVVERELLRLYQDLPAFVRAHRHDFVDFPR